MAQRSDLVESMAIAGAVACLAHCIAVPMLVAFLPALAMVMPVPATFHLLALGFAVPTTAFALYLGYRRHGWPSPLIGGFVGLALLAVGVLAFGEGPLEVPVTVLGSLAIVGAHATNWRYRRMASLRLS
jgi:hypothetical protein